MSYEIAIVNPRRKRRSRKAPSKAQRAARARFVAKFAKGKKSRRRRKLAKSTNSGVPAMAKRRKRRSASRSAKGRFTKRTHATRRRRRSSAKRTPAQGYTIGSRPIRRRKLNPRVRRRRYRRNPLGLPSLGGLTSQLMPAALGAGGAIALNVSLSFLPLPDMLKTGWARHGVRIAGALGLGWIAKKFLGGKKSEALALGALTVVLYDIGKQLLQTAAPEFGARLGDFEDVTVSDDSGFYDPASVISGTGAYLEGISGIDEYGNADDVGAYLEGDLDGNLDGITV